MKSMVEVYKIYNDNNGNHVATIYYNQRTNLYDSEVLIKNESPILFAKCEYGVHWGEMPHPPQECIENWLKDRVIPENRQNIKELLERYGLYEYDWRVLIKLNHGRSVTDYYSVEVEEIDEDL